MSRIKNISASEILDSRGNPTVRVWVTLNDGTRASASVPSGASTGVHEALELRDNDKKRYSGKGVLRAVAHIETEIAPLLRGMSVEDQQGLDRKMIATDGTPNKSRLGANAILGVSLACAHTAAQSRRLPLYRYIRKTYGIKEGNWYLPYPTMNIINGGKHADSGLSIQEFMIMPRHERFSERVRMGAEIFHALQTLLREKGFPALVGDEGGFAPLLGKNTKALDLIVQATKKANYEPGKNVFIGLDFAASEFYSSKGYALEAAKRLTALQMIEVIDSWARKYPLRLVEDGLAQDDWKGWQALTKKLGKQILLVGDDLFVTNSKRLQEGIDKGVANAILIKLNQIGSLTETVECILLAKQNQYAVNVSHRSGETSDTTIADLAVALNADYIKTGSLSRSERVEKYNRLMEIEAEIQK